HVATLNPSEGFYASEEASQGTVGSLIGGQPVSHVAMDASLTRNVWTAIEPDIETPNLKRIVSAGNSTLPPSEALVAIAYLARAYIQHPPPTQFNFLVSPLVFWIWIGGLIAAGGGLIALWPAPSVVRRRVAARSRARALRGLARA
ncbi:MAG: hypothetical protein ABR992_14525, partial [Solirubrobacteraceae bacterium]